MPLDVQKYKKGADYRMIEHYIRYRDTNKDVTYKNPDLDKTRTCDNYSIGINRNDKYKYLKDKIKEYDSKIPPKRLKKDRVTLTGFCFTVPESIANTDKEKEYFEHCYNWLKKTVGEDNIVCFEVHRDEIHDYYDTNKKEWITSRGHAHAGVIPYTNEKGVNCKNFMTRQNLREWHKDLDKYIYEKMGIHDLTNGDKSLNGRDHDSLKRESIKAVAEMRDKLDKDILDKTTDLNQLNEVYEYEVTQITEELEQTEKHVEARIRSVNEQTDKQIIEAQKRASEAEQRAYTTIESLNTEIKELDTQKSKLQKELDEKHIELDKVQSEVEESLVSQKTKLKKIRKEITDSLIERNHIKKEIIDRTNHLNTINKVSKKAIALSIERIPFFDEVGKGVIKELEGMTREVLQSSEHIHDEYER